MPAFHRVKEEEGKARGGRNGVKVAERGIDSGESRSGDVRSLFWKLDCLCECLLKSSLQGLFSAQDEPHISVSCRALTPSQAFSCSCTLSFLMGGGGRGGGIIHFYKTL